MPRLSAFVTTYNDEETIEACLESLKWADEIVVLDSFSTDRTVEISSRYTSRVLQHRFLGYGRQKQLAMDHCTCDWVLFLDSDEILSPRLQKEIQQLMKSEPRADGYEIARCEQMFWKMAHPGTRHNFFLRLFRKEKTFFNTVPVHAGPETKGKIAKLRAPFLHFGERSIHEKVDKVNHYSTGLASYRIEEGKLSSPWMMVFHPPVTFLRQYFMKRQFLNGWAGFITAVTMAFYAFMKCAKTYEHLCRQRYGSAKLPPECPRLEAPKTKESNSVPVVPVVVATLTDAKTSAAKAA